MSKVDPTGALRGALQVLSRTEVEAAWRAGDAATKALGPNLALRAELAAYVMARILDDIGSTTTRPDDLSDVTGAVEALAMYVCGRMTTIVSEAGNADPAN
jgi:hypothetical protein